MGHEDAVLGIAYSVDGTHLASCSADKTLRLWDISAETCVWIGQGHSDRVTCVAFTPDGSQVSPHSKSSTNGRG
jgi:WD40 repeat protein